MTFFIWYLLIAIFFAVAFYVLHHASIEMQNGIKDYPTFHEIAEWSPLKRLVYNFSDIDLLNCVVYIIFWPCVLVYLTISLVLGGSLRKLSKNIAKRFL